MLRAAAAMRIYRDYTGQFVRDRLLSICQRAPDIQWMSDQR